MPLQLRAYIVRDPSVRRSLTREIPDQVRDDGESGEPRRIKPSSEVVALRATLSSAPSGHLPSKEGLTGARFARFFYAPSARPIIRRYAPPSSRRRLARCALRAIFLCAFGAPSSHSPIPHSPFPMIWGSRNKFGMTACEGLIGARFARFFMRLRRARFLVSLFIIFFRIFGEIEI